MNLDENLNEEIYINCIEMDSLSDNSLDPNKPAEWGEYLQKPCAQIQWENMVKTSICEIVKAQDNVDNDVRPYVKDQLTSQWCLVDTGAAATIVPRSATDSLTLDNKVVLKAVNGTHIQTYGKKL